jgi:hypothetical protein
MVVRKILSSEEESSQSHFLLFSGKTGKMQPAEYIVQFLQPQLSKQGFLGLKVPENMYNIKKRKVTANHSLLYHQMGGQQNDAILTGSKLESIQEPVYMLTPYACPQVLIQCKTNIRNKEPMILIFSKFP